MGSTTTLEAVRAYKCTDCGDIAAEASEEVLYDCGNDGPFIRSNSADGDSNRCPECNKFGAKVADEACGSCQAAGVEEIDAYHCTGCGAYFEEPDDDECPDCKRRETDRQETERLSKLPVDQRGGQKTFATREDAVEAFTKFLASVKSEHVTLSPSRDYGHDGDTKGGVQWRELPRPLVGFHFQAAVTLLDRYVRQPESDDDVFGGVQVNYSDQFYLDVKAAAVEHLKGSIHWNNSRSAGWVYIEE